MTHSNSRSCQPTRWAATLAAGWIVLAATAGQAQDAQVFAGNIVIATPSPTCDVEEGLVLPSVLEVRRHTPAKLINTYPGITERCRLTGFNVAPYGRIDCDYLRGETIVARADGDWRRKSGDSFVTNGPLDEEKSLELEIQMRRCSLVLDFVGVRVAPDAVPNL
jgi:hypothetical protein